MTSNSPTKYNNVISSKILTKFDLINLFKNFKKLNCIYLKMQCCHGPQYKDDTFVCYIISINFKISIVTYGLQLF